MNKRGVPLFLEKLLNRTGAWYPLLVLLAQQTVNTPLVILLTAMPAQENANFSQAQAAGLLGFGSIALVIRNVSLLFFFYYSNQDLISRLAKLSQLVAANDDPEQEKRAWEQANLASKRYIFVEFFALLLAVLAPMLVFGYVSLQITPAQMVYLSLAALAAGLVNLIMESIVLERWFEPVMQVLLPERFEVQLAGMKGMRIWVKLSVAILGLVFIGLFLTVPTAYYQINLVDSDAAYSPQLVDNALLTIVKASIGAIVVGVFLSFALISYFSIPFRKMTHLLREVEAGDLSRRIDTSQSDEFGKLHIYLNRTIDRLQVLTSTLEQQVAERTAQLSQANEQLVIELKERKRVENQLAHTALHDPLTDLPNRVLFTDRLNHAMEHARRHKNFSFAVFFLDLDRFKVVNDSLGHNIGDLLLVESARRLATCVRMEDTVARLGGDEFVLLIESMDRPAEYVQVANRILDSLAQPLNLEDHTVFVSVSIGIVLSDVGYERPGDILRDADIAMYHAKRQGRGRYEIFNLAMRESVTTRLELETGLRRALTNQEFVVYYQPILNLGTRRIVGFEALVRWRHPTRGLILPAEFIPAAEEAGLIVPLGYWVLEEACRQIGAWQEQYPANPPLTMNVNFSARQCAEMDFVDRIVEVLQRNGLDPGCLKLELTESLIVKDSRYMAEMLEKLRDIGIQVQIDDFGTGYSSLGYLHTLPVDTLKIDRAFISRLETNAGGTEIVQMILALAHSLGMKVVAEGVETEEQLSALRTMDCEYVQGFLLARPVDNQAAGVLIEKSLSEGA